MKLKYAISGLLVMLFCFVEASAQSDRTFVSSHGVDNASCGAFDGPCRSFGAALPKTNAGGEIIALDSGIYDDFNIVISQSVTLTAAPGVHAELSNSISEGDRITVNATTSDTVVLRNLYLSTQGSGGSVNGVGVNKVGTLHVENCVISGFNFGIRFNPNASAQAFIQDTTVRNSVAAGILFGSSAGVIKGSIDHCRLENNGTSTMRDGLEVSFGKVTVRDSVAAGNGAAGFSVLGGDLSLEHCEASNNNDGVVVSGASQPSTTATVSNSIVTNNHRYGFLQSGGVFHSLGNNTVRRNGTNTSGTITVVPST